MIGAVYGQLAGALYGQGAIPPGWLAALAGRALLEAMADRLLTAALVGLAETAPENFQRRRCGQPPPDWLEFADDSDRA